MKPRVLFVGRTRYRLPLNDTLARKFEALRAVLELRVLAARSASAAPGDGEFVLVPPLRPAKLDGFLFYFTLPFRVARRLRDFNAHAVIVESPYEGFAVLIGRRLARSKAPLILEVHGDWRTAMRLYGVPARRLLAPLADWVAATAVRRADAVRPVSQGMADIVRSVGKEPDEVFPAFIDIEPFTEPPIAPLPEQPRAIFIGVLELYKNIDGLAEAWRMAAPRVPNAHFRLVGVGSRPDIIEQLVADLPEQTSWTPVLTTEEVSKALDEASVLVLPSRSEGLGRVIVEALCRGRPVVASWSGGTPDVIQDGVNGILVHPEDTKTIADVLVRVLSDRELVERMAAAARPSAEPFVATPDEYARRVRALVDKVAG